MGRLTPKQIKFVTYYIKYGEGTKAAKKAGYAPKWADRIAYQLLENDGVQAELKRRTRKHYTHHDCTLENVVGELVKIGLANIDDIAEFSGDKVTLKDSSELTRSQLAAVQEVSQKSGNTDEIKLKMYDKTKALVVMLEHLKESGESIQKPIQLLYGLPGRETGPKESSSTQRVKDSINEKTSSEEPKIENIGDAAQVAADHVKITEPAKSRDMKSLQSDPIFKNPVDSPKKKKIPIDPKVGF